MLFYFLHLVFIFIFDIFKKKIYFIKVWEAKLYVTIQKNFDSNNLKFMSTLSVTKYIKLSSL